MRAVLAAVTAGCLAAAGAEAQQPAPPGPAAPVLHVQRGVSMIVTPAGNLAVQVGDDGVLLVDSVPAPLAPQVMAAVRTLSSKPIHTMIMTSLHTASGIQALVPARGPGAPSVRVIARDAVLTRLLAARSAANVPAGGLRLNAVIELPVNNTYFTPSRDFYLNGESVFIHHAPAAHTDGDSIVHFRGSDVLAVGNLFNPDVYPVIDLANGGSVNGLIAALNRILELAVPAKYQEGGTYVIPAHGRLCDEAEVVEFRDMVTIVRDRVREMRRKGMTANQVQAAAPSRDYDPEYGGTGASSPAQFVDAVFRSLSGGER